VRKRLQSVATWLFVTGFVALVVWFGYSWWPSVVIHNANPPVCPPDCLYGRMRGNSNRLDGYEYVDQVTRTYCPLHSEDSPVRKP
jgi:hypothetical protein